MNESRTLVVDGPYAFLTRTLGDTVDKVNLGPVKVLETAVKPSLLVLGRPEPVGILVTVRGMHVPAGGVEVNDAAGVWIASSETYIYRAAAPPTLHVLPFIEGCP